MNKELKISDKSPFEKIRKFDGQGRSYWTSRELCAALGYSTMQHVELFNYESFTLKTVENLFSSSRR